MLEPAKPPFVLTKLNFLYKKAPGYARALKKQVFIKRGCFQHRKQPLFVWPIRIGGEKHFRIDDSQSLYFTCTKPSVILKDFFSALGCAKGLV